MSDATLPPQERFQLRMLLQDRRYRSMTIQIVVLLLVLCGFFWLARNAAINLAELGKPIRFDFLWQTAGYDIPQRLIAYEATDTHFRATMVGLLNTLLVAVMGCITATFIGLIGGVLRLSNNWLIARIVTLYVEIFRNVPVLLWIIACMLTVITLFPQPREFRGEDPAAAMVLWDSVALTNRGFYIPAAELTRGLGSLNLGFMSISLNFIVIVALLVGGIFAIRWNNARATRLQIETGVRPGTFWPNMAMLFLPLIAVLIALGFTLEKPELRGFNFSGGITMSAPLIGLWLGLSLYTGTYIVEIVRSGIMAVSKGQTEAAAALGIRPNRIMTLVILPQALRVIIPQLISQYLNLTKNSSLAVAIGYADLVATLGTTTLNQTGREMETILLLMAIYLTISLSISGVMNWYDERVKLVER
ncbi:MAG: ABC transporter permease subunit [Pseudomonadota bacterium]